MNTTRWACASLAWALLILVLLLLPSTPFPSSIFTWDDKAAHLLLFSVQMILTRRAIPYHSGRVWALVLAFAFVSEGLQMATETRSADLVDVVADGCGLMLGWGLDRWWMRRSVPLGPGLPTRE